MIPFGDLISSWKRDEKWIIITSDHTNLNKASFISRTAVFDLHLEWVHLCARPGQRELNCITLMSFVPLHWSDPASFWSVDGWQMLVCSGALKINKITLRCCFPSKKITQKIQFIFHKMLHTFCFSQDFKIWGRFLAIFESHHFLFIIIDRNSVLWLHTHSSKLYVLVRESEWARGLPI